jgi:hypothetical protein
MAKEDFNQVSSSFEAVQCILYSILCPLIFRQMCAHCNASPLHCPINATYSSSYVFRLQYPRVLHCRIVPIEKLKTFVALERKEPPITHLLYRIRIKTKSFKSHAQSSRKLLVRYMTGGGGANIFMKRLFATQQPN